MPLPPEFWIDEPEPAPPKKPALGWQPDPITFTKDEAKRITLWTTNGQPMFLQRKGHGGRSMVGLVCAAFPYKPLHELDVSDWEVGVWWMTARRYQQIRDINNEFPLDQHDIQAVKEVNPRNHIPTMKFNPCQDSVYKVHADGRHPGFGSMFGRLDELAEAIKQGWEVSL